MRPPFVKAAPTRGQRFRPLPLHSLVWAGRLVPFLLLVSCAHVDASAVFPDSTWQAYATPEEAGWSSEKLASVQAFYEGIESAALLVVFDGAVLVGWGDVDRRFMCHSVRKSFLSALYGIHVAEGNIHLDKTLESIGIDDEPPLLPSEKEARIIDLLKSRSGVYHPAAYETAAMKERRPARGSHRADELWYYNNWDFNALGTIFERETGRGMFEEFQARIADPVGMQDFRLMDTYHHLESQHSRHPAYPFKMSARDMARFGLLFLREGRWRERQLIPEEWIAASSRSYSSVPYWEGYGYGYMWWVCTDEADPKQGMVLALGYGGHMIAVLPRDGLVIVNRANTYFGQATQKAQLMELIDRILDSRVAAPVEEPQLVMFQPVRRPSEATGSEKPRRRAAGDFNLLPYEGSFHLDREETHVETVPYVIGDMIGERVRTEARDDHLLMTDEMGQRFLLFPEAPGKFVIEDSEIPVLFEMDAAGLPAAITLDAMPAWRVFGEASES
jgi:CubicO group peptidase (beta-lactamase class C family)